MARRSKKLFYKIGEVCAICGVEAHVLRYWENEFSPLSPAKNRAGQRIYRQKDIDLIESIKYLLYEKGYTVAGANRKLLEEGYGGKEGIPLFQDALKADQRRALREIKKDVQELRSILERDSE